MPATETETLNYDGGSPQGQEAGLITDILKTKHLVPADSKIKTPHFPINHTLIPNTTTPPPLPSSELQNWISMDF